MRTLSAALLLLTVQPMITTVLAAPPLRVPDYESGKPCTILDKGNCTDTEFCGFKQHCVEKFSEGMPCMFHSHCLSESCPGTGIFGKCAAPCSGPGCTKPGRNIGIKCSKNEQCKSKTCIDTICQMPAAKKVGEACTDKDVCQFGSMCWKGSCSRRGFKADGSPGGKCFDNNGQFQCHEEVTYCDPSAGFTCQRKKSASAPCGVKIGQVNIPARDQCMSDRCVEDGFCGTITRGAVGDPCAKDKDVCREENKCVDGPGDGKNGPKKICQPKYPHGVGKPCSNQGDCTNSLKCYTGEGAGKCVPWVTIQDKPCKVEEDCGGRADRKTEWTNFGAFDGVDGGWGNRKILSGYVCRDYRCKYVYETVDDTKPIPED